MTLPPGLRPLPDVLRRQLAPGEQVLWQGRPPQGLMLRRADAWLIPFSCLWGGFAIFWEMQALQMKGEDGFFPLFGLIFVGLGLYLMLGRFWVDAYLRKRIHYALTNERLLLSGGWNGQQIKVLPLRSLPQLSLTLHANGGGVIELGEGGGLPMNPRTLPPGWPGAPTLPPVLELAGNAQHVFQRIQQAQRQSA